MKILSRIGRGLCAVLLWLLAFVLLLLAVILCITVLLIPLGLPLGALSLRLFRMGFSLMLPKPLRQAAAAPEKAAKSAGEGMENLKSKSGELVKRHAPGRKKKLGLRRKRSASEQIKGTSRRLMGKRGKRPSALKISK